MKKQIKAFFAACMIAAVGFYTVPPVRAEERSPVYGKDLEDGTYTIEVSLGGGSGRSAILSPAELIIREGIPYARIVWNSRHYDYMMVEDVKYLPVKDQDNQEGYSVFEIPITVFDAPMPVIGDTTAMSIPHEVEYTLTFQSDSIRERAQGMSKSGNKKIYSLILCVLMLLFLVGCSRTEHSSGMSGKQDDREISSALVYDHSMELHYAEQFSADYYQDGYVLISVSDGNRYLLVPEGLPVPEDLEQDIVILCQPVAQIYLVASAVMDMFVSMDALDMVRFSGLKTDAWYIDEVRDAMDAGRILYAGKYSAPDYEKLLSEQCGLAIENTMIHHAPEVREQLEKLGIPVLIDYSSYEESPLGRMEWVRLYGLLIGREDEANAAFEQQAEIFESLEGQEKRNQTVAFFYINSNGEVNVRRSSDYLPKMIEMAGGTYVFDGLGEDKSASSTFSMQMEEFYAAARDADFLIYNTTIEGELMELEDLKAKSTLLNQFRAVQEGRVYCTSKNLYQSSMELGTILLDICRMLQGKEGQLTYLYKLE